MNDYNLKIIISFIFSFVVSFMLIPFLIKYLKGINANQRVSEYALKEFKAKNQTPIMGGLIFVFIPLFTMIIINYKEFINYESLLIFSFFILFSLIGFIDDYLIVVKNNNNGLSPKLKLILQILITVIIYFSFNKAFSNELYIPILKIFIPLGIYYLPFMIFMLCAESNATNFTDGMDGLLAGVSIIALIPYLIIAYNENRIEIVLILVSILASLIAYLAYNKFPAKIFMGDVGSLALGALFSIISILLKMELVLIIIGGVFVWEIASVVIQIFWVKVFKKRIFLYTPIHYSFKKRGLSEQKVVSLFYAVAIVLAIVGYLIALL